MYNLCDPNVIRQVMNHAGITFRHSFGQNFLINKEIPEHISEECSLSKDSLIIEIGPGIGCLTQELAKRYRKVIAIEIDKGLIPVLSETLSEFNNVVVVNNDVMKVNLLELIQEYDSEYNDKKRDISVCANLPYYITTPIIMSLLESHLPIDCITVMVQKEFADRLVSNNTSSDYGAITASVNYYGKVTKLFGVPRQCFMPAPNVDSTVIRIDLYKEKPYYVENEKLFFAVLRGAFEMRRKTLQNALTSKIASITKDDVVEALRQMNLVSDIRGEKLSTEQFAILSNLLNQIIKQKEL